MVPEIGEIISHYRILAALGSGGMGKVFLAEDTKLGRKTALKFLSPAFASDRDHADRFVREARASSFLNHPNICTIYEINESSDPPFIAMEYVEGETVAEMIRRRKRSLRQTLDIAIQVAEALGEAHSNGIIHRDVKPANIVVSGRGRVKILDFGLAKRTALFDEAGSSSFQTNAGVVLGTASYMSPEQARGLEVDVRSDIWSLGICIYEMVTGVLPFSGETAADTFAAILTLEPKLPSLHASDIPEELDRVVMHAISKQRELRFQSTEELIAGLKALETKLNDRKFVLHPETSSSADEPTEVFATAPTESNNIPATDHDRAAPKTAPNNLTAAYSPIIGRSHEISEICGLLLQPENQLVTMTGIGGTGKTTLSRAVARNLLEQFEHGVFFIEMANVTRPEVVAATIAQPLGLREEGGKPLIDYLKDYLSDRKMLLVIDNFEQVVEAAPQVGELIAAAPELKILVTSRELLRLTGEIEYQVPPLDLPNIDDSSFEELSSNEALMLFAARARNAKPAFSLTPDNIADAVAICSRLEGLPLAIELAAARVKLLSPGALLSRLENRLDLLTGGSRDLPERQRTMRGAVAWSYDLLTEEEKAGFRELSVFSGGFRIEAADRICSEQKGTSLLDIIGSLIDKSLIVQKDLSDGESRFRMLDVVREFALEMLNAEGEGQSIQRRHADFFAELAETAEPQLQGAESERWLARLEEDHDNMRAALNWSLVKAPETGIRLVVALRNYWLVKSHLTEGFGWLKAASEAGFDPPASLRFKLLNGLGLAARFRGDFETAKNAYEKGLNAGIEAGDRPGTALSNRGLGLVSMQQGDLAAARLYFDAGLAISRDLNDRYGIAMSLSFLGDLARTEGRYEDARPQFEEAVELFRGLENRTAVSDALNNLGAALVCLGQVTEAEDCFAKALDSAKGLSNRITISCSLDGFAAIAAHSGEFEKAARFSGAAEGLRELVGYKIEPAEARFRELYLSKLRDKMPGSALAIRLNAGRELPLDVIIDEALSKDAQLSIPVVS